MDGTAPGRPVLPRHDYAGDGLDESEVAASPYLQAREWVDAALAAASAERDDLPEPTALSVATVDATGTPNVRTVLMRFFDERGPGFVTNLESTKSIELLANPRIAAAISAGARSPWTATGHTITGRGQRSLKRCMMSRITAPVGDVTIPMLRGRNGMRFLRAASNRPSAASFFLRASSIAIKAPRPASSIRSTMSW